MKRRSEVSLTPQKTHQTESETTLEKKNPPQPVNIIEGEEHEAPAAPPISVDKEKPKIGVILGPGGLRTFAHIGFLQELTKTRQNIVAIAGIEMGALVAGIYATKAQTYDVEWQMFKLKEDEVLSRGLLGGSAKAQSVSVLSDFLNESLQGSRADEAKTPFACLSYNSQKKEIFIMSKGKFSEMLLYCLPSLPLYKPYAGNISPLSVTEPLVKFLKNKGAVQIYYIDLLSDRGPYFSQDLLSPEESLWLTSQLSIKEHMASYGPSVQVVTVDLSGFELNDFSKRRAVLQKGQEAAKRFTESLNKK